MLPAADVLGVDVLPVASASSSNRACSGLETVCERVGGAGARRLFERLFRNKSGPRLPVIESNDQNEKKQTQMQMKMLFAKW